MVEEYTKGIFALGSTLFDLKREEIIQALMIDRILTGQIICRKKMEPTFKGNY